MDRYERKEIIRQKVEIVPPGCISVGCTYLDGRCLFKHRRKHSQAFYGICHYSKRVFIVTPLDWPRVTMLVTIRVSPKYNYCEREQTCLDFKCELNRFDKHAYVAEFKDAGTFSLGLPLNLGSEPLWFSDQKWKWERFILSPMGGILRFDEREKEVGD